MGLRPTEGNEKRLGSATALDLTVALSFVIPKRLQFYGPFFDRGVMGLRSTEGKENVSVRQPPSI